MYYKHGGIRRQRTEDQAFISFHLQAGQICKSLNTLLLLKTGPGHWTRSLDPGSWNRTLDPHSEKPGPFNTRN